MRTPNITAEQLLNFPVRPTSNAVTPTRTSETAPKILSFKINERTAGKMPEWHTAQTPKEMTQATLAQAQQLAQQEPSTGSGAVNALTPITEPSQPEDESFSFGDVIDIINPLHHIPVVGTAYRYITGDNLKSIGSLIGGAIYGGAPGAAMGLVNIIAQAETGQDFAPAIINKLNSLSKNSSEEHLAQQKEKNNTFNSEALLAYQQTTPYRHLT